MKTIEELKDVIVSQVFEIKNLHSEIEAGKEEIEKYRKWWLEDNAQLKLLSEHAKEQFEQTTAEHKEV